MELCIMNVMQYDYIAHLQINLNGNECVGVKCLHVLPSGVTQQGESRPTFSTCVGECHNWAKDIWDEPHERGANPFASLTIRKQSTGATSAICHCHVHFITIHSLVFLNILLIKLASDKHHVRNYIFCLPVQNSLSWCLANVGWYQNIAMQ